MPVLALSSWNLSTLTLASSKSNKQRNKLRRRRRPPPLRDMTGDRNGVNGTDVTPSMPTPKSASSTGRSASPTLHEKHVSDPRERDTDKDDAQAQVINSLRAQVTDLITQVSQLNSKLVKSYDRVSDLEDELHVASANARSQSLKISNLEIERAQHLAALNTGLYVEKEHVTSELTRLMERATAEAAARGQAETARADIERDLDDLSANLFNQANTMVAEERLGRAMSERKVVESEEALKGAEEAVALMQLQMQALRDEKDRKEQELLRMRALMEKGKYIEHPLPIATTSVKLFSFHSPYQEFTQFVVHLRSIRHSALGPPQISTLLPLPFLARIQNEDSDPTLRLDIAPSLNWLSRRSVLTAIHTGQLTIEPMSVTALMSESILSGLQSMIAGSQQNIVCALCGAHVYPPKDAHALPPPSHPLSSLTLGRHSPSTWSTSLFKNPLSNAAPSPPLTPPRELSAPPTPTETSSSMTTVYVFRVTHTQPLQVPSGLPGSQLGQIQRVTSYPLCTSGWCLARLRTTCSLWAFIRAGVIDRVWEEEPALKAPSLSSASSYSVVSSVTNGSTTTLAMQREPAPPLPPRRRSKMSTSVGALWGAIRSATPGSSQPASPVPNGTKEAEKEEKGTEEAPDTPTRKAPSLPLRVNVPPPPLPRRSLDRRATANELSTKETPKEEEPSDEKHSSPERASNEVSMEEKTPVSQPRPGSPPVRPSLEAHHISVANSQASSGFGEEFSTPVEEMSSTIIPSRPQTPLSPRSPRSPRSASSSASSPRSPPSSFPQRLGSPPPLHSPRAVPLPDSRPSTPGSPRGHSRRESGIVPIAPLNIDPEKTSRPPSRTGAASPKPVSAASPPALPRRAPARRAVPPPPRAPNVQQTATPPSSGSTGSNDEKETAPPAERSSVENTDHQEEKEIGEKHKEKPEESKKSGTRKNFDFLPPPPRPPPRRSAQTSASGFGDKDDARMDSIQGRSRLKVNGAVLEDEDSKKFVGDASWEERAWKEIVRLREDMFWARVGAIRG